MSFFNFSKKPSQGISLQHLRQLILSGSGRLRIVAAPDWSLTRADGSIPDAEDRKCYRQQGDTLYIGTDNGISHRYVLGTVCKGKSRINFPQEPTRLGDDTN